MGGAVPRPAAGRRIIDLRGRTVVPGIIDNHNHIVAMGNRPGYHTPLENATSIADVQAIIAARAAAAPKGVWITTIGGFHRNQLVAPPEMARLPDAGGARQGRAEQSRVPVGRLQRSVGHEQPGQEVLREPDSADSGRRRRIDGSRGRRQPGRALLVLRQTLLNAAERRRGAIDAMNYGLSLGVTTHLDQGVFQATNTPSDGAAHEDNYTMQLPFVALHRDGLLPARLRINYPPSGRDAGPDHAERAGPQHHSRSSATT